jgi:hypothetical protein
MDEVPWEARGTSTSLRSGGLLWVLLAAGVVCLGIVAVLAYRGGLNAAGSFGDALGPAVGFFTLAGFIYQIRSSARDLSRDRTSDALRLVTEWLESNEAREARRELFGKTFINREVP